MGYKSVVRGRGGIEEGEEEVVSSIPGGAGFPASINIFDLQLSKSLFK